MVVVGVCTGISMIQVVVVVVVVKECFPGEVLSWIMVMIQMLSQAEKEGLDAVRAGDETQDQLDPMKAS